MSAQSKEADMKLQWINKRVTIEDVIKRYEKVERLLKKANKELELIRISLNLR